MSAPILNNAQALRLILTRGLFANLAWSGAYFYTVSTADWSEEWLISLYKQGKFGEFFLGSYAFDLGFLTYPIYSCFYFWTASRHFANGRLKDVVRAVIILLATCLVLLQPLLIITYQFGPRSW